MRWPGGRAGALPLLAVMLVLGVVLGSPREAAAGDPATPNAAPLRLAAPAGATHYQGRPLIEALEDLQRRGLRVIFSSDLVRPGMIVTVEPSGVWLHEVLEQLLAPHGLAAELGPGGSLLVVRAPPRQPLSVRIVRPAAGEVTVGEVEVGVAVTGEPSVARLDLLLDGEPVGSRTAPPWRFRAVAPTGGAVLRWTAVAHAVDGSTASDSVTTRDVVVSEQVEVSLRQLFVGVTRAAGRQLDAQDFTLFDDGRRQTVVSFGRGLSQVSAVLLLDASDSMAGGPLASAFAGARAFLDRLGSDDQADALLFSDRLLDSTGFRPAAETREALSRLDAGAGGGTALHDQIYLALRLLEDRPGHRVVVVLSDGADVASVLSMRDVLWKVRRSDATIYWLRLDSWGEDGTSFSSSWRDSNENRAQLRELEQATEASGGSILAVRRPEQIAAAFDAVAAEVREQYVLGWYPDERRGTGTWHPLAVRVAVPGVHLRYRAGYSER